MLVVVEMDVVVLDIGEFVCREIELRGDDILSDRAAVGEVLRRVTRDRGRSWWRTRRLPPALLRS